MKVKYNLSSRYDELSERQKIALRAEYMGLFGKAMGTFYRAIKGQTLDASQAYFFAKKLDCRIEDLFENVPEILPLEKKRVSVAGVELIRQTVLVA